MTAHPTVTCLSTAALILGGIPLQLGGDGKGQLRTRQLPGITTRQGAVRGSFLAVLLPSLVLFAARRGGGDEDARLKDVWVGQDNVDSGLVASDILQLSHVRP